MEALSHEEITTMFLSLGLLLGVARALGEIAQWLRQPLVVGEILAGVLLGPTIFGAFAPDYHAHLFPTEGHVAVVHNGLTTLAITLFLLVAGMEVDLSTAWRQGTTALKIAVTGMVVPFAFGFLSAWYIPKAMGAHSEADPLIFALFFATALSISALPVIAKTLMDLKLYRSDLGILIVSAAIINDLVGWLIFAFILGMMGHSPDAETQIGFTILWTLVFAVGMLSLGRWLIHHALLHIQAHTHWPGGVLSFAIVLAMFAAALTEHIGIHAIFGAFFVGVAIGDSSHLRERTRAIIDHFISFIFAPLFFASIGVHIDLRASWDTVIILTTLGLACFGKLAGCWLGGMWAKLPARDRWAVSFGMNSRGAMEIILGLLALQSGVIGTRLFVALVVMALVTSMMSGPAMQLILNRRRFRGAADLLSSDRFLRRMEAATASAAIQELTIAACAKANVDPKDVEQAVRFREDAMPTGLGNGVAVPHARILGLAGPVVALGISEVGIDFDAPDGEPAHIMFLILTPSDDDGVQLELMAQIGHAFRTREMTERLLRATNLTQVLAILRSEPGLPHS